MVCDTFPEQSASFYASNNDYEHSEASMWPSPTKWDYVHPLDANASSSDQYNNQIYLRLAETYLVLAEAQLMDPAQGPAVAAVTLNVLRSRQMPHLLAQLISILILFWMRGHESFIPKNIDGTTCSGRVNSLKESGHIICLPSTP